MNVKWFVVCSVFLLVLGGDCLGGSFRVLGLSQVRGLEVLEIVSGDEIKKVPISISSVSPEYSIPESGRVDFFRKAPVGDETAIPVFSVKFPSPDEDMIVLLRVGDKNSTVPYQHVLIADSTEDFPLGSVLILNLCSKTVAAKMGEESVIVPPGEERIVRLVKKDRPFNGGVKFAAEFNGFGKVFSTSSWYLLPSMKVFCIIYRNEKGDPAIRRIRLT